jgi:PAS domain S-box-containing protein
MRVPAGCAADRLAGPPPVAAMNAPAPPQTPSPPVLAALVDLPDVALVLVDRRLRVRWISGAAAALAGTDAAAAAGRPLVDVMRWSRPAELLETLAAGREVDAMVLEGSDAAGVPQHCRIHVRRIAGEGGEPWHAVSMVDVGAAQRLAERLEVIQEFGRLGVWERDVDSLRGRWERQVFRLWGLDPAAGAPDLAGAVQRVVEEDRTAAAVFRESLQRAGTYSTRFRVRLDDGSVRPLHSQWRVFEGPDGRPARAIGVMRDDTEAYELSRSVESTQLQLRLALEAARIGLWRHDLRTNRILYDARAFQILGMPIRPEGMALSEVRTWIHPDDLPAVLASAQRTLTSGEPSDAQARYRHADGSWRYIVTRRVLERDAAGQPMAFVGVGLDMTEQVERTAQALELAARLEAAARAARVGIWTTSVGTDETDWNAQMYELFDMVGEARSPSLRQWVSRCVHPDDRGQVYRRARAYLRAGDEPLELELRTVRRDGSVRWLVVRADVDRQRQDTRRLFGVAIDVTEQHEAMEALRRANERADLITRGVGIGTWEQDLGSDEASWDAQMFLLRGLEPGGRALNEAERLAIVHPADQPRMRGLYRRPDVQGRTTQVEFRVRLPDGSWRWLASRSAEIPSRDGRPARRIGINWDVSDVKVAEDALRDKLVAQRASEAKSRFLARMSHELRTPLNAVLGFTQLLIHEPGPGDPEARRRRLLHIQSAARHLLSLINDVLDLSSVDSGEMRLTLGAVVIDRLWHDTVPLVEGLARQYGVAIDGDLPPLRVHADATRLRQVLVNLLTNAIKYNRRGGRVEVRGRAHAGGAGRRVRISVSDTGRGMTPAQLRQVFEPFNRLGIEREGIEGTGIGLAIVKALVERMGGQVTVHSRTGEGTCFELDLPAAADLEPETSPLPLVDEQAIAHGAPVAGRNLLYIEDNPVNAMIVRELVERRGDLTLRVAGNGHDGVAAAREQHPDLILLDMQLPDIDGHEVLRRLRDDPVTAGIPCIALSANAMPEDIDRALAAGFADYWTKPLDFGAFMHSLDVLFGPAG